MNIVTWRRFTVIFSIALLNYAQEVQHLYLLLNLDSLHMTVLLSSRHVYQLAIPQLHTRHHTWMYPCPVNSLEVQLIPKYEANHHYVCHNLLIKNAQVFKLAAMKHSLDFGI